MLWGRVHPVTLPTQACCVCLYVVLSCHCVCLVCWVRSPGQPRKGFPFPLLKHAVGLCLKGVVFVLLCRVAVCLLCPVCSAPSFLPPQADPHDVEGAGGCNAVLTNAGAAASHGMSDVYNMALLGSATILLLVNRSRRSLTPVDCSCQLCQHHKPAYGRCTGNCALLCAEVL
jgi:hypothetical protein